MLRTEGACGAPESRQISASADVSWDSRPRRSSASRDYPVTRTGRAGRLAVLTYLLGLDVGSGRCKAALIEADGRMRRLAVRPMPLRRGPNGEATYDAEAVAALAMDAARESIGDDAAEIAGVGVASMAESGVPLDGRGEPLADIIAWFDPRGGEEAAALAKAQDGAALYVATGLVVDRKQTLPRLIWLRRHAPEVMRRMHRWAGVADFVALRLGGGLATHPSLAGRTLAYDLRAGRWAAERLSLAGVTPEQMPAVGEVALPVGAVTPEAATAIGLRRGIPVIVAGHDHVVGAFAVGAIRPGIAADSMGTAEAACIAGQPPPFDLRLRDAGLTAGRHIAPATWYVLGGLPTGGAILDWLAGVFGRERLDPGLDQPVTLPTGLVVLPYLRGRAAPDPDRDAAAMIAGLRAGDDLSTVAAAALEGTGLHLRWMLGRMAELTGDALEEVRLYGGGTRLARWLEIKASVNPWPTSVMEAEAVAVGAALAAGVAGGVFSSVDEAAGRATAHRRLEAEPAAAEGYRRLFRDRYLPLVRLS